MQKCTSALGSCQQHSHTKFTLCKLKFTLLPDTIGICNYACSQLSHTSPLQSEIKNLIGQTQMAMDALTSSSKLCKNFLVSPPFLALPVFLPSFSFFFFFGGGEEKLGLD